MRKLMMAVLLAFSVLGCDPAPKPVDTSGAVTQTVDPEAPVAVVTQGTTVDVITPRAVRSRYVPPEGGANFHTERYHQAIVARDSLLREVPAPGDSAAEATGRPERIAASVDSLTRVINYPEQYGILTVKTFGTCLRPMAGIGWNGQADFVAGAKVLFWNRTGVVVGLTGHQAGAGLSYRLDGMVPFLRNTEATVLYGVPYEKENGGLFVGLTVGL